MATKTPTPRKRAKAAAAAPVRPEEHDEHNEHDEHDEHDEHEHRHTEEDVLRHDVATGHGLGSRVECCTQCCPECQTNPPSHDHHDWDHFPTDGELAERGLTATAPSEQELLRLAASSRFAAATSLGDLAAGLAMTGMPNHTVSRAIDRTMLDQTTRGGGRISPDLELRPLRSRLFTDVIRFRPSWHEGLMRVIASYGRVRRNHLSLSAEERDRFNRALAAMDGNPAWQTLLNYHANAALYRIHSMHGPVGTQRFLSWHRKYLFEAEQMLRTVEPTLTIPYWDYAADGNRPDWVHLPSGVNRPATGTAGWLPSGGTIATILGHGDYTGFTTDLESNAHNQVHNWCGGTLRNPSTASFDPIFWMLHGNVDRIWSVWQETHTSPTVHAPSVTGADAVLDPWTVTITDVDDTAWDLAYRYA